MMNWWTFDWYADLSRINGLESQFSENGSRHLQNVGRICGNIQQKSIHFCSPQILWNSGESGKNTVGEILKNWMRFKQIVQTFQGSWGDVAKKIRKRVFSEMYLDSCVDLEQIIWKYTCSHKMSLSWSRQRAVRSQSVDSFGNVLQFWRTGDE